MDNSINDRIYPQKADFTFYGGIYRDISLMVVSKNHIALGHFGDTGVKITPALKDGKADIRVETSWKARALSPSSCRTQPEASWPGLRAQTLSSTSTLPTSGTA